MNDEYEIIYVVGEGRAVKDNKTGKIYYDEFQIIEELKKELQRKDNIISELKNELYHIYNYAGLETKELADKINELEGKNEKQN